MACPCSRILRAWTMNICGIFIYGCLKTWLSDFTFTFHFHALEKEMATHSTVLAWRIPGTGEPGRLPSMGSHRVRHDWSDLAAASALVSAMYQSLNLFQNSLFHCCCSVTQSCPTLCNPMYFSMPDFPVLHNLPELAQTHVHWVGNAIQPSHSLSSPSPPAFSLSHHDCLFWVGSLHQVARVMEVQLQDQSFQWILRVDFLQDLLAQSLCSPTYSQEYSPTPLFKSINFFSSQSSLWSRSLALDLTQNSQSCKSLGEGNGTPLQYSCLENPMDGGALWAAVHGVAKS